MKTKILLFVIVFIFSSNIFAGNVTLQQAKKVALNFYFEKYNQFEGQVLYDQLAILSTHVESDGVQDYYYVFHVNKGGFIIVPANDCLTPVLGYSFKHNFVSEKQPHGLFRQSLKIQCIFEIVSRGIHHLYLPINLSLSIHW